MIRHVEALYRYHSLGRGKVIRSIADADLPPVETDPTLLGRVLGNLLKNALEASTDGDVVTLQGVRENDDILFRVHNTAAMPEDVKLQVFQRSFSTKARDRGVGTYSARLLTERMLGGRIWFTSSAEDGTAFTVALPVSVSPYTDDE
jgi:signal transduction histidine kinase